MRHLLGARRFTDTKSWKSHQSPLLSPFYRWESGGMGLKCLPKTAHLVRYGSFGVFGQGQWEEGARVPPWIEPYYAEAESSSPSRL